MPTQMDSPRAERFSCQRNALTIRGHVFGRSASPRPAVILSHGFLANEHMCQGYAQLLASLGYVAFTFDFCGGGLGCKSDGRSRDMTVLTELDDLLCVFAHVKALPYVDSASISLLGCSQGGLVSAMAARRLDTDMTKLLLLYPALCIPDDARAGKMLRFRFDPQHIPDVLGRFPMTLGGDYARCVISMNVYQEIGGFDGPVLYLHGTEDRIVNLSYARQAAPFYPHCDYHEIIGGGHGFRGAAEEEARRHITRFMSLTAL